MATTIKLKNGSGAPAASDLVQGEPAIDLTNKRLYTENASGVVIEVGSNPSSLSINGTAVTATAAEINILDGVTSSTAELNILDGVTSTAAELNILDGVTSTTAELNILDGVTSTAAELNILDGVTSTTAELNILDGVTATASELNILDGVTSTTAELNILDGVTSTAAELNILDGVTSSTAELNILDGVTSTTAELNILDGVTSTAAELNILDGKAFLDEDDMSSNSATGIPSQQSVKAYVDANAGGSGGISNVVEDTTPQLGGSLDVNGNAIVSVSNGNIALTPNGTGLVRLDGNVDIQSGEIVLKNSGSVSNIKLYCESSNAHYTQLQSAAHSAYSGNVTVTLPAATDTLVGKATTDTLTNKTLTSPKINEDVAVTSTATELNILDGVTATTAELNYVDGVTSAIQTQLDAKAAVASPTFTGTVTIPTADINGGNIDGTTIGGSSAAAGTFTTITGSGDLAVDTDTLFVDVSADNVGIGTTSPADKLHVYSGNSGVSSNHSYTQLIVENGSHAAIQISTPTNAEAALWFADSDDAAAGGIAYNHNDNDLYFRANGNERMRIDSGGDVGIGTSSPSAKLHIDTSGTALKCTGAAVFGADAHTKLTTYSDTNYVGIYNGSSLTADEAIYMGGDHIYFYAYNTEAARLNSSHLYGRNVFPFVDNTYDLGGTSSRWDDVYATNSSIQTSDEREKQDIEELTEAETRVAVAAKALLRKYRWKNAVEAKDNNPDSDEEARIHFGIVAQDLKGAFEAEGLDAGRYGMFVHSTWTDEETDEERDLMGVRYSELLAFIIAAI